MPSYPGAAGATVPAASNLSPIALQKGEGAYVLGQLAATATQLPIHSGNVATEAAAGTTQASIAVDLSSQVTDNPPSVSVEIHFSAAPGAGESIAIQEADTDADAFYITPSNANYTVNAFDATTFNARVDLSPTGGKFMRVKRTKGANAVGCWVKITRLG